MSREYQKLLRDGAEAWNQWRSTNTREPYISGDLRHINAAGADLQRVYFHDADFREATLDGARFDGSTFSGKIDFARAQLNRATFNKVQVDHGVVDFSDAKCQSAILTDAWLPGTYLTDANLYKADLSRSKLDESALNGADMRGATLNDTYLAKADLTRTNLSGAVIVRAFLAQAKFHGTDLRMALLSSVNLHEADLQACKMGYTTLVDVDLRTVQGLDSVSHDGPSSVGIDTIYRSQGLISKAFLRNAGVPEAVIASASSLFSEARPLEFHSCFISYAHRDQELAQRLYADLQLKGVRCWFAPADMKIGDKLRDSLDQAIQIYDRLVVLLSDKSVKSQWVEKEVETAFEKERQQNRLVLFPIRLDDEVMAIEKGWAADIRRTRHIGDFRNWKNRAAYERALASLLEDLRIDLKS